jgi:hypothetical protein
MREAGFALQSEGRAACCTLGGRRAQRTQFTYVKSTAHLPAVKDRLLEKGVFCLTTIVDFFRHKRWPLTGIDQRLL